MRGWGGTGVWVSFCSAVYCLVRKRVVGFCLKMLNSRLPWFSQAFSFLGSSGNLPRGSAMASPPPQGVLVLGARAPRQTGASLCGKRRGREGSCCRPSHRGPVSAHRWPVAAARLVALRPSRPAGPRPARPDPPSAGPAAPAACHPACPRRPPQSPKQAPAAATVVFARGGRRFLGDPVSVLLPVWRRPGQLVWEAGRQPAEVPKPPGRREVKAPRNGARRKPLCSQGARASPVLGGAPPPRPADGGGGLAPQGRSLPRALPSVPASGQRV